MDYIPYTNFRKFKVPAASPESVSKTPKSPSWLGSTKGLNVMAEYVDECSNNRGCLPCTHPNCARVSEDTVMLCLNGLSPSSIGNRIVHPQEGAQMLVSFTIEWLGASLVGSETPSDQGSPTSSEDDTPPQRLSRESSGSETRSYWDTILGDSPGSTWDRASS